MLGVILVVDVTLEVCLGLMKYVDWSEGTHFVAGGVGKDQVICESFYMSTACPGIPQFTPGAPRDRPKAAFAG